ncbi:MAG: PEFG-CTERM sorting domain-containing protein [Candidatus Nitrosopelagicus sp.]|nr:PEFG-CTERM sorting domain-containing protein [Candidatus Nitrosopelagicus sp.]
MESKEISVIIVSSLILLPFFAGEAFAQENQSLTITTEKESYSAGEPIQIVGLVESKVTDFKVTLRVFNPVNNLITIDELDVNDDGTFHGEIPTSIGGLWEKDGTYTIIANYYASEVATIQFEYGVMVSAGVQDVVPEFSVTEDDDYLQSTMLEDYELGYELTGAKIIRITPDTEMKSLIFEIETYSDGELRITLPKDVIDTDEEGFFILVDGIETNHEAVSNLENWSFVIPFSYGSEEIEIIGTFVIPEFGTIAVLVLVTSIAVIVMISAKNKQIFYPKM